MIGLIPQAHAQAAGAAPGAQDAGIFQLVMLVGLFVMFYFIAIRPQRKRQKEHNELIANLAKGDEVVTNSGMLGKVVKLDEDYIVLKVAENVELKFQKFAVHAVLPKGTLKSV